MALSVIMQTEGKIPERSKPGAEASLLRSRARAIACDDRAERYGVNVNVNVNNGVQPLASHAKGRVLLRS